MPFLGNEPSNTFVSIAKQTITGNGGTSYALSYPVTSANDIDVFFNNVRQEPTVAYTATGTTITFTEAIASTDSVYVLYNAQAIGTISPPTGSVGQSALTADAVATSNIVNSAVTTVKILDNGITTEKIANSAIISSKIGYSSAPIQIVQQQFTSFEETSATNYVDSNVSINITTTRANSKILYNGMIGWNPSVGRYLKYRLLRNGTDIYSPGRISPKYDGGGDSDIPGMVLYLDSPNVAAGTTLTYKIQYYSQQGLGVVRINDNLKSNVTLMELTS